MVPLTALGVSADEVPASCHWSYPHAGSYIFPEIPVYNSRFSLNCKCYRKTALLQST